MDYEKEINLLRAELANEKKKTQLLRIQTNCLNQDMKRLVEAFEQVRSHRDVLLEKTKPDSPKFTCMN
jgi:archaellum component FlaC